MSSERAKSFRPDRRLGAEALTLTLCVSLSLAPQGAALAQPVPPAATGSNTSNVPIAQNETVRGAPQASGNGYAEMLKPIALRRARGAAADLGPYEPIKTPIDDSNIAEITMFIGESRVFPAPGVSRIAVGNGSLLSAAALDGKEVILFANQEGTSSLFIWNSDGRYQRVKINIVPGDTSRYAREIAAFLANIPNAKTSVVGSNIIVEGDQLSDADLNKVDVLAKRYPQIVNFTNRIGWEQMVSIDVKVVEFPTTMLKETGLKWSGTGGGAVGAIWGPIRRGADGPYEIAVRTSGDANAPPVTGPGGGAAVIPSALNIGSVLNIGLNAQLNLLAQEGKAALLAEPQLSARNGSKASFLAGGEIPYAVSNRDGVSILFKTYGIKLAITPRVDSQGNIRSTIESEVSSIDRSVTTLGGPALLTRKTETEFNVRNGETIVLSGLLQRENSNDVDKLPVLGDIPILGALFRSKRYQNKETELVVFVTPRLTAADAPANRDRIERTTERLEQRMGAQPYLSDPLQPGVSYDKAPPAAEPAPVTPPAVVPQVLGRSQDGAMLRINVARQTLHTQANASAPVLLSLEQGAVVVLGQADAQTVGDRRWLNVRVGQLDGWLPAEAVVPWRMGTTSAEVVALPVRSAPPLTPVLLGKSALDAQGQAFRVQAEKLALRLTPDVNATVLTRALRGDTVRRLDTPPQGAWVAVQLGDGDAAKRGWVLSQWLVPLTSP